MVESRRWAFLWRTRPSPHSLPPPCCSPAVSTSSSSSLVWGMFFSLVWLIATPTRDRSWSKPSQKWGCGMHDFLAYFGDYKYVLSQELLLVADFQVCWHGSNRQPPYNPQVMIFMGNHPKMVGSLGKNHMTFDRPPKTNGLFGRMW